MCTAALLRQTATLIAMAGPATPEKVRVVVGDDHPLFREGVVRALSLSGSVNVVGEADDGSAALELIKAHRPDVALLDYRMPGMDGAQVAAAVRSSGTADPRVAAFGARRARHRVPSTAAGRRRFRAEGLDPHRDRPGRARLRERVATWWRRRWSGVLPRRFANAQNPGLPCSVHGSARCSIGLLVVKASLRSQANCTWRRRRSKRMCNACTRSSV